MFRFRLFKTRKDPEPAGEDKSGVGEEYDYHISQVFMGHHSIVTLVGFTVGGILVGRGLYEVLIRAVGVYGTIGIKSFIYGKQSSTRSHNHGDCL